VGPPAPRGPSERSASGREPVGPSTGEVLGPVVPWAGAVVLGAAVGARIGTRSAGQVTAWVTAGGPGLGRVAVALLTVLAVAGVTAAAVLAARHPGSARVGAASVGVVVLVAVLLAGARTATHGLGALPDLAAQGGSVPVALIVVAEPRPIATGWHVPVRVTDVDGTATRERAAVALRPDALDGPPLGGQPPTLGSRWHGRASARPLPEGGYGRWLAGQHLTAVLDVDALHPAGEPRLLARSSEHVRAATRAAATAHAGERVGGLLVGLVNGDTRLLPDADRAAMEATGTTHLTAVSGMHVATVVGGVLAACGLLRAGARTRRVAVAVVVCWFAYLTRFQPSVLRAGTVAAVVLLAAGRGVLRDGRHALAGAVVLLVLVDPLLAGSLGLLLSATAAAGVLVVAPRVRERLTRLPRRVADVLAVTIGAQVAVVPLLLASFGEVPLASVPANLVAVPLAVVAAVVAFPATVVAAVHVPSGAVLFAVAGVPARGILAVANATAGWGGVASVAAPSTAAALVVASVWALTRPGTRPARWVAAATAVACVVAAVPPVVGRTVPARTFSVTAIDVGQGDAFLLRTPGARVLVDAGGDGLAARWLTRHGHTDLDLLVVTHGHLDHVGGGPDVLARARVGAVWRPPSPEPIAAVDRLDRAAADAGVPVREVVAPAEAVVGDLHLEVLGPPPGRPYRHANSEINEASLVLRVTWRDRVALTTGDVERAAQADLLALADARVAAGHPDALRAGLLTVPHHGSSTSDPAFLARVGARVGLISAGADNSHGHPHRDTLDALAAAGTEVRRTDLEGTVSVEVPPTRGAVEARRAPSLASRHEPRPPPRRRRRPAPPARTGAGPRRPAHRGPRADGRGARRRRDRPPARAAHRLAVRRPDVRGPPRRREPVG
jgi:competence protein ComEC